MPLEFTEKQRKAIQGVASGMSYTEAGRKAGYGSNTAPQAVSKLMKRADAKQYLETIREKADSDVIMDVKARREHLSQIATSQLATPTEQMAAIHLLNRMDNLYKEKVETDVRHSGGVMLIPATRSIDDWEAQAASDQLKLMEDAIDV